ncbi:MAG: methylated-DNA--[protein]-cysteine S-methyltransferase [Oscillospiraceae bacterium]|nr:methylated-DNA--[protein]-cysteine S-methyltransferase [Oscillospiraceae bacterium]
MTYTCTLNTQAGDMRAAAENDALTGLWFVGQKHYPIYPIDRAEWTDQPDHPVFVMLREWLSEYFCGNIPAYSVKLAPKGTDFQKSVWDALADIPYGQTVSYKDIADRVSCLSPRAVGGAVGRNPISILIPCHRVIGSGGGLTGYAGGTDKKAALLKIEGRS